MSLSEELLGFSASSFVENAARNLTDQVESQGFSGAVLGASGGVDSALVAALCMRASAGRGRWPVFALQMIDARIRGERYRPGLYRELGTQLVQMDITDESAALEKQQGLPPRWLTLLLTKLVLRTLPAPARRRVVAAAVAGDLPARGRKHAQVLLLSHRVRLTRLREYAARYKLLVVTCANRTEASLGYFVEGGVDDPQMGDCAPLLDLYKSQVLQAARALELPEEIIGQPPSPGFGGIRDEEILGPYALVDQVLLGLERNYTDEAIAQATGPEPGDLSCVRFIRRLTELAAQKPGR